MKKHKAALEQGDAPVYTDAMFNFIPGSCFEIAMSLSILDAPGAAGLVIDNYTIQIDKMLKKVYETSFGDTEIQLSPTAQPITLRDYFNNKILKELAPTADQIGRCLDPTDNQKKNWLDKEGISWLSQQLTLSSHSKEYNYINMLTKVRTISAVGTIFRELIPNCRSTLVELTNKNDTQLRERHEHLENTIRHENFDQPSTRARTEKMPLIEGKALNSYENVDSTLTEAGPKGLGFGKIWHQDSMIPILDINQGAEVVEKYAQAEKAQGRQGIARQGQDITDLNRPGLLGESSMKLIPKAFQEIGLEKQLASHHLEHGSGINRWRLTGSYAKESWYNNLPAAGAHSGGTSDIFLALNCVGKESIFGTPDAIKAGLIISSFMNFGGYHSYVETFPIAQAVSADTKFKVNVSSEQHRLYEDMAKASKFTDASFIVASEYKAYKQTILEMKKALPLEHDKKNSKHNIVDTLDLAIPAEKKTYSSEAYKIKFKENLEQYLVDNEEDNDFKKRGG